MGARYDQLFEDYVDVLCELSEARRKVAKWKERYYKERGVVDAYEALLNGEDDELNWGEPPSGGGDFEFPHPLRIDDEWPEGEWVEDENGEPYWQNARAITIPDTVLKVVISDGPPTIENVENYTVLSESAPSFVKDRWWAELENDCRT